LGRRCWPSLLWAEKTTLSLFILAIRISYE
jgi:hypothetical protein